MLFKKNKKKIILVYLICYTALFLLISLLSLVSFLWMILGEVFLVVAIIAFLKLHIAEVKQTVQVSDEKLICKNFIINGRVANAEISYEMIERIEFKKRCIFVFVSGEKPFRITSDYINYPALCKALCEKCKDAEIAK